MIFVRKILFPQILGAIPGSKAEIEWIRPQQQLHDHGEHCFTGTVVLNILFMRLLTLLYSISLDAYACDCESRKFSNISQLYSIITVFDIIPPGSHNLAGIPESRY